jgi:hypothetical protein
MGSAALSASTLHQASAASLNTVMRTPREVIEAVKAIRRLGQMKILGAAAG